MPIETVKFEKDINRILHNFESALNQITLLARNLLCIKGLPKEVKTQETNVGIGEFSFPKKQNLIFSNGKDLIISKRKEAE